MGLEATLESPLAQAVRAAGSQSAFGRLVGKRQSVIHDWLRLNKPLPAEHVLTVERELGIPKARLRPDLFDVDVGAQRVPDNRDALEPAR